MSSMTLLQNFQFSIRVNLPGRIEEFCFIPRSSKGCWMIRGAYTPSPRVQTVPFGRSRYIRVFIPYPSISCTHLFQDVICLCRFSVFLPWLFYVPSFGINLANLKRPWHPINELTQTSHEWILKNSTESSAAGWTTTQQRRNIQKSTMPSKSYQVAAGNSPFYRRYVRMSRQNFFPKKKQTMMPKCPKNECLPTAPNLRTHRSWFVQNCRYR